MQDVLEELGVKMVLVGELLVDARHKAVVFVRRRGVSRDVVSGAGQGGIRRRIVAHQRRARRVDAGRRSRSCSNDVIRVRVALAGSYIYRASERVGIENLYAAGANAARIES